MYGLGLAGAFLLALVLGAAFGRTWFRVYELWGLGLVLGFFVLLAAYLSAPPDLAHSGGTEGQEYLGRWWDVEYVLILTAIGYVAWLGGVGIGALGRLAIDSSRTQKTK